MQQNKNGWQKKSTLNTICKKPNQSIDNDPVNGIQRNKKNVRKKFRRTRNN